MGGFNCKGKNCFQVWAVEPRSRFCCPVHVVDLFTSGGNIRMHLTIVKLKMLA